MAKKKGKKIIIEEQPYYKYAKDIVEGRITSGTYVRLACERYLNDIKRKDLIFDAEEVDKAIRFVNIFKHFKGDANGKPFYLEPWQTFIFANIIGFTYKNTGERRFKQSYIQMARKGGKTCLTASLSLYYLVASGIASPSIAFCGASRDQAAIAFDFVEKWSKQIDPSAKNIKILRNEIKLAINNGKMKVYSSDVKGGIEGGQFDFAIVDEFHQHPNSQVFDSVKGGMIGSKSHLSVITTAGFDLTSPCYVMRDSCINMLNGVIENDRMFALIYELDDGDNWDCEDVWLKCQPNLGITCPIEFMRGQVEAAKSNPSETVSVMTKNLNIWQKVSEVWLPDKWIYQSLQKLDWSDFKGEKCYVGIDLAAVSDFCSIAFCFKKQDKFYIKINYYLPEECLVTSPNREKYKAWKRQGFLQTTPGNVTDYSYILSDILRIRNNYGIKILNVYFDRFNSTQFVLDCLEKKLPMQEYSQSIASFNRPTKEFERLMLSNKIVLDKNECSVFCLQNCQIKKDHNDNIKPVRNGNSGKIDGAIAAIQSMVGWIETMQYSGKIFFFS